MVVEVPPNGRAVQPVRRLGGLVTLVPLGKAEMQLMLTMPSTSVEGLVVAVGMEVAERGRQ